MNSRIKLSGESLRNFELNLNKEYFIGNGMGSFSGGSPNGNHTRQYHGLFIRSFLSPINRFMAVHKVEETILGKSLAVYSKMVANKEVIVRGDKYLQKFSYSPFPTFKYFVEGIAFEKEIIMANMRDLVGVRYTLSHPVKDFFVDFFMNFRDVHSFNAENKSYIIQKEEDCYSILLNDEKMYIYTDGVITIVKDSDEVEGFTGKIENEVLRKGLVYHIALNERGEVNLDSSKRVLKLDFSRKHSGYLICSFEKLSKEETLDKIAEKEALRIENIKNTVGEDPFLQDLAVSADAFITHKASTNGKTIVAGYPWFNDWGRDTMIAFTGCTLVTKRFDDARSILKTFAEYCDKGMLPNNFPDSAVDTPMYNTIDGTLWYFYAIYKYYEYTKDLDFIEKNLYSVLEDIIEWHIKGTRYDIKVDMEDGLLSGGNEKTQLTWMDVKYKGFAVTPRWGKAVEINALWYNGLKTLKFFAELLKKQFKYDSYITKIESNFRKVLWNDLEYLNDYVSTREVNNQIRPNQIIAASLPFTILKQNEIKKIADVVYEHLYTPVGLRSLSKVDDDYHGKYIGNLHDRDMVYHQGTVWSWMIGPFIDVYNSAYSGKNSEKLLEGLKEHFYNDACLGSVSEIFDGDEPFYARGCYAQAWGVAELLRVYSEYVVNSKNNVTQSKLFDR